MNWRDFTRLTGGDVWFLVGVLVGLVVAGVVALAVALWVARVMVGG